MKSPPTSYSCGADDGSRMNGKDAKARLMYALVAAVVAAAALLRVVYRKGRPFMTGDVFRASRWNSPGSRAGEGVR